MITVENVLEKLNKAFGDLKFDESSHTYTVDNIKFSSVTTEIKAFVEPFNPNMMAAIMAKSYNKKHPKRPKKTAAWYKLYWRNKANEAASRGHRVHQFAELYPDFGLPSCEQEQGVFDFFEVLPKHYKVVAAEYRVYSKKRKLAGTIDLLLLNTLTGKLVIADWKTNMTNVMQCYGNKKMKGPFKDLHDISYNKFAIQLSQYKALIEEATDLEVEEHWIIWLRSGNCFDLEKGKDPNKYSVIDPTGEFEKEENYVWFKMPMYDSEILNYKKEDEAPKKPKKNTTAKKAHSALSLSMRKRRNGRK